VYSTSGALHSLGKDGVRRDSDGLESGGQALSRILGTGVEARSAIAESPNPSSRAGTHLQLVGVPFTSFRPTMEASVHEEEVEVGVEPRVLHLSLEGGRRERPGVEEDDGVAGKVHGLRNKLSSIHSGVGDVVKMAAERERRDQLDLATKGSPKLRSQVSTKRYIDVRHVGTATWGERSRREKVDGGFLR
jgi:hypothetical protein